MPKFSFHGPCSEHGIDRKYTKLNTVPKDKLFNIIIFNMWKKTRQNIFKCLKYILKKEKSTLEVLEVKKS